MTPEHVVGLRERAAQGEDLRKLACEFGVTYYAALSAVRGKTYAGAPGPITPPARIEHGQSRTPEYQVWLSMVRRCEEIGRRDYARYGGRGIRVCPRWRESFPVFLSDLGARPSPTHSIDRIDPDGNYEPSNVRWATDAEQRRNKRTTRMIEFGGERLCVADMARKHGLSPYVVYVRLNNGWAAERALTTQVRA